MSTQYPVLNNRPINLWKVVELKEELKRRKLLTRGLKDDLIKRLHEAINMEMSTSQAEASEVVSSKPEDVGKSLLQPHSNHAEMVGNSRNDANHTPNSVKVHDIVAGAEIDTDPGQIDQEKVEEEIIGCTETVVMVEKPADSETYETTSNIMNVVSVSKNASIDEGLESTKIVADDVVRKSPQKDVVQAEVLKPSLNSRGSFNEVETLQIGTSEKTSDNDRAKVEIGDQKSPLFDAIVVGKADAVEPLMESVGVVEEVGVLQVVSNDKAQERNEADVEKGSLNPSQMDTDYDASDSSNQVHEVVENLGSQVKLESISTDTLSNYEMNEYDDKLTADNAHLELEINKSEIVQSAASEELPPNDGRLDMGDHLPHAGEGFAAETNRDSNVNNECVDGVSAAISKSGLSPLDNPIVEDVMENNPIEPDTNSSFKGNSMELPAMLTTKDESSDDVVGTEVPPDNMKTNASGSVEEENSQDGHSRSPDVDFSKMAEGGDEKINIDQTLDDDSLDNVSEMNDVETVYVPDQVGEKMEFTEVHGVKMSNAVETVEPDSSFIKTDSSPEKMDKIAAASEKRKFPDEAATGHEGPPKRQCNGNFEDLNIPKQLGSGVPVPTKIEDSFNATIPKMALISSTSALSRDAPKERIVPPSSEPPTNALRIDHFLRPFTLKSVQELLAKTGTVCSFWMDNIKTHCYVTYSSVDEAVETRNALYNLQWPPNGGRYLLAKFVDPEEVKIRVESPKHPANAQITAAPNGTPDEAPVQPPTSTKQKDLRQHIRSQPPPPLPEKVDSPIVTLDDFFRKTRAMPQIYYLPLTEEEVAAKKVNRSKQR